MNLANNYHAVINPHSGKVPILMKSILVGLLAGAVVNTYRFVLTEAEEWSFLAYGYLRGHLNLFPLAILFLAGAGYLTGYLVSRYPMISGSGIPQVSGIIRGHFRHHWFSTLLAKFVGGALALFCGLSLGREGPSIQLGACVAQGVGNRFSSIRTERKILIASGASAGLAAAFNAPMAGAMFALEEIFRYFSPVILLSTMTSAVVADFTSRVIFGMDPIFRFTLETLIPLEDYWILFLLGGLLGACGAFYNKVLLMTQKIYKKIPFFSTRTRLLIPFLMAGILGLSFPLVLGSGHRMIEELKPEAAIAFLLVLLAAKFLFSMISFGSGAPGGIFFPLLILGATVGALFGKGMAFIPGMDPALFDYWIVLAMAGLFTAIVRAPITGILLLVEMTGSFSHLLPIAIVAIVAYVTADLLKSKPIYESLLENLVRDRQAPMDEQDSSRRITVETVVHHGAPAENKRVREIELPESSLLIAVRRDGKDIIPRGDTLIQAQDYLILLTSVKEEARVREILESLTNSD